MLLLELVVDLGDGLVLDDLVAQLLDHVAQLQVALRELLHQILRAQRIVELQLEILDHRLGILELGQQRVVGSS